MSYDRQLDLVVTTFFTIVVFFGSIFYFALPLSVSLAVAVVVFVAGLMLGRRVVGILDVLFG
jgi:hypothetical protein